MTSLRRVWLIYFASLMLAGSAAFWLTSMIWQLDRQDAVAQQKSDFEESVRLALWRMDAALLPVVSQELTRPTWHYLPQAPIPFACDINGNPVSTETVYAPSPLETFRSEWVYLHFELPRTGVIYSPEVVESRRASWLARYLEEPLDLDSPRAQLRRLQDLLQQHRLWEAFPETQNDQVPQQLAWERPQASTESNANASQQAFSQQDSLSQQDAVQQSVTPQLFPQQAGVPPSQLGINDLPAMDNRGLSQQGVGAGNEGMGLAEQENSGSIDPFGSESFATSQSNQAVGNLPVAALPVPGGDALPQMALAPRGENGMSPLGVGQAENGEFAEGQSRKLGRDRNTTDQQDLRNQMEFAQRQKNIYQSTTIYNEYNRRLSLKKGEQESSDAYALQAESELPREYVGQGKFVWLGEELLLVRSVNRDGVWSLQGCWLHWRNLRQLCLMEVKDLLPDSDISSAPEWQINGSARANRFLASAPIRLLPGEMPAVKSSFSGALHWPMLIAWLGLLVAVLAFSLLLAGTVSLSQRRADFVSAVTHELRTPLTTFRMYTQLLQRGLIEHPVKAREYLATLEGEAGRLGHLVENVLSYARLERGKRVGERFSQGITEVLERIEPQLSQRVDLAGGELKVHIAPECRDGIITTDPTALGQILFNLVDNACKYGVGSNLQVDLNVSKEKRFLGRSRWLIEVSDQGPGMSQEAKRKLFQQFSKSARAAAESAPGVGLGLALCRRLARHLGGELRLSSKKILGCCFQLMLP